MPLLKSCARHSIREFEPELVPIETIRQLVEAAGRAPSSKKLGTSASAYSYGTFLDCGFVLDNLMLGLTALGYGSCPQFSVMIYPDLLKSTSPTAPTPSSSPACPSAAQSWAATSTPSTPPASPSTTGSKSWSEIDWMSGRASGAHCFQCTLIPLFLCRRQFTEANCRQ